VEVLVLRVAEELLLRVAWLPLVVEVLREGVVQVAEDEPLLVASDFLVCWDELLVCEEEERVGAAVERVDDDEERVWVEVERFCSEFDLERVCAPT